MCSSFARLYRNGKVRSEAAWRRRTSHAEGTASAKRIETGMCMSQGEIASHPTVQRTRTGGTWRLKWKAVGKLKNLQGTETRAEIVYWVDNREP